MTRTLKFEDKDRVLQVVLEDLAGGQGLYSKTTTPGYSEEYLIPVSKPFFTVTSSTVVVTEFTRSHNHT